MRHDHPAPANAFRSMPVHPGTILVIRPGSEALHPITDDAFDPSKEQPAGIALWGALPGKDRTTWVRVGDALPPEYVPLVAGEMLHPGTGVGTIDAWIIRADALRHLLRGAERVFSEVSPLSRSQFDAAIAEVAMQVRATAERILATAPELVKGLLVAWVEAARPERPVPEELEVVIQNLSGLSPHWYRPLYELFESLHSIPIEARTIARFTGIADERRREDRAAVSLLFPPAFANAASITEARTMVKARNRPPESLDPVPRDLIVNVCMAIDRLEPCINRAKAALRTHGPEMNQALTPGTLLWTTRTYVMLDAMLHITSSIRITITSPMFLQGEAVKALRALADQSEVLLRDVQGVLHQASVGTSSDMDSGPRWLTVTQASKLSTLGTPQISRLATEGELRSNGKRGPERRIDALSLVGLMQTKPVLRPSPGRR